MTNRNNGRIFVIKKRIIELIVFRWYLRVDMVLKENMNLSRKLVWGSIILILGIISGYFTHIYYLWSILLLLSLFILLFLAYFSGQGVVQGLLIVFIFVLGFTWIDWNEKNLYFLEKWYNENIQITGEVADIIPRDNQVVLKIISINGMNLKNAGKITVQTAWADTNVYHWGDKVAFKGKLEKPLPQVNPGGFSERDYWRQKGIGYKLSGIREGKILEKAQGIKKYTKTVREEIYGLINTSLPSDEAGLLLGLLLGDKKGINKDFYSTTQKMGIAHVFAVSGLHIGVILAFYLGVTRLFKLSYTLTIFGASILLGSYCLLAGFTSSVVRASIMGFLGLLAVKWLRYKDFYTILAAAAWIIILSDPLSIFSIGFQLSFITTWGLFYFLPLGQRLFSFLPEKAALVLAVPVAAQMASLPVTLYHFNTLSLLAPLMNLIVVPIVSVLMPLLFITLFLAFFWGTLAQPFILLAGGIAYLLSSFIDYFTQVFSQGHVYLARPSLIVIAGYYLCLIFLRETGSFKGILSKISWKIKLLTVLMPVLLVLWIILRPLPLEVVFLDVGQGDGAVLRTPHNYYVVIDGGPGSTTVTQYLRYQGVNKVALVILSHPDADHINGLYQVLKDFTVETLLVPPDVGESQELIQLKALAQKKNTRIIEGKQGLFLKLRNVTFQVLAPDVKILEGKDTNEASLIVNCTYGNQDFLFTGDVSKNIMEGLVPLERNIEVIKVPHHGSRGSYTDTFYKEIKPKVAIISAGRDNRYGHPHLEVLEGLAEEKVKIYRTDKQGAVIFYTDGEDLWVRTMLN